MCETSVIWFRNGLRIHDNPALLEAVKCKREGKIKLLPLFIFDGESAGTKLVGYNRMKFLLESLEDLDKQFREQGGRLYLFKGNPVNIFKRLKDEISVSKICYEQDCEPIWKSRDDAVTTFCQEVGIECIEKVSHTLWEPKLVVKTNGGIPPLTYQMFLHTVDVLGKPSRPVENPEWSGVEFIEIPDDLKKELNVLEKLPTPEDFNIVRENTQLNAVVNWKGGETQALLNLEQRLLVEEEAFKRGYYLPNQACPDILGPPTSISAHLKFGCLSVRKFYWAVHDLFKESQRASGYIFPHGPHITGQLIWREYFYTMSVNNPNYGRMEGNNICLNIPWSLPSDSVLDRWKYGKTGFPLVDAAMRQLLAEGWLHHTLRNVVATFLTRGGLWISWEYGLEHFLKYLLDADWSVCAGNWMWVSSSAFEMLLDSSQCTCPTALARRLDPHGEYICRYVPELGKLPKKYIHEPWNAPLDIQRESGCILGVHYPQRIIDFSTALKRNNNAMKMLRKALISKQEALPHCRPSNEDEVRTFFWLVD